MILILLGPPGAGKGSQASKLIKEYGITHISTGDIFRRNVKEQTELGKKVKEIIESGSLVSDELTNELVFDTLSKESNPNGFMLDGYPRNLNQACAFDKWLEDNNKELDEVVYIGASVDTLISRISGRRVCKNCGATYHVTNLPPKVEGVCDICGGELLQRPDDNEETARQRIEIYENETSPLIEYYKKSDKLKKYDGNKDIEDVFVEIKKSLE